MGLFSENATGKNAVNNKQYKHAYLKVNHVCRLSVNQHNTIRNHLQNLWPIHLLHKHRHQTQTQCWSPGFYPCRADSRCACYKTYGKFTRTVTSTTKGETFILAGHTTCQTSNVIYLIECNNCDDQYIGETKNSIHCRTYQHRSDINGDQKNNSRKN